MHCSTKVLKVICRFFPLPLPWPPVTALEIGAASRSLEDDRSVLVPDGECSLLVVVVIAEVEQLESEPTDSAVPGTPSATLRGGETLRGTFHLRTRDVSLFIRKRLGL